MAFSVPSLKKACILRIVKDIKKLYHGVCFEELARYHYVLGPFENLSSPCIECILQYLASTRQLSRSWLSLLLVTHLRALDMSACPSSVNLALFKSLKFRCKHLERLIIPHCKKVPNGILCDVLRQNSSLLHLDISNKQSPKVDAEVIRTIARSCHNLRVLKLSDYRLEDPHCLLYLCGKVAVETNHSVAGGRDAHQRDLCRGRPSIMIHNSCTPGSEMDTGGTCISSRDTPKQHSAGSQACGSTSRGEEGSSPLDHMDEDIYQPDGQELRGDQIVLAGPVVPEEALLEEEASLPCKPSSSNGLQVHIRVASGRFLPADSAAAAPNGHNNNQHNSNNTWKPSGAGPTQEERQNAAGPSASTSTFATAAKTLSDGDEDRYETDKPVLPIALEDHSDEFGCLELESLWLDNVNINDQIVAVLMEYLPRLRHLNLSDTDICNPWKLLVLELEKTTHLRHLCLLDVRSTALSTTALQLIPLVHPNLQKFSVSGTMLPPSTYASIGLLGGVAELELIGGQFYLAPPRDVFQLGIAVAIRKIGAHLHSLNLTYFAHVEFEVVVANCPRLEVLDLSHTDIKVAHTCPSISEACPLLSFLSLAFAHLHATRPGSANEHHQHHQQQQQYNQNRINAAELPVEMAVRKILGQPQNLEELYLSGLAVDDGALCEVFPGHSYPLRVLDVSFCKKLTIEGVKHLWQQCYQLQRIDLTSCTDITVADYKAFCQSCYDERPIFKQEGTIEWK